MRFEYKTDRMILRVVSQNYADIILNFYNKNKSYLEPFEPERHPDFYTRDFQMRNLAFEYNQFLQAKHMRVWMFSRDNPLVAIGTVCFSNFRHGAFSSCDVGYKIDHAFSGQGYMKEALSFLLPLVCEEYHFHRVEAYVMPNNLPSIALLEKLEFRCEGLIQDFAKIQNQWQAHYMYSYLHLQS